MASIVSVNCESGALRRYEIGGESWRLTHQAVPEGGPSILNPKMIENFRIWPDDAFSVDPPPRPTSPNATSGQVRIAVAA